MATKILPYPPVRPMDPVYMNKFLSSTKMSQNMIKGFVRALNKYNQSCNKAVTKFEEDINKLMHPK
jgi:hypothetical protein